jgi:hypothetical protein
MIMLDNAVANIAPASIQRAPASRSAAACTESCHNASLAWP